IGKGAPDEKKVSLYGNIIAFGSLKHYFYFLLSKVHISAHVNGCCPPDSLQTTRRLKKLFGFRDVFIPHGVSYGIAEFCLKKYTDIDLFITSGEPEYRNVKENYGYSEDEVAYTGFPRLDRWYGAERKKNQIVLMPTWRLYLTQNADTVFTETDYFMAYQSLLCSEELKKVLEKHSLTLVFYLHDNMKQYAHEFVTDCENIVVVSSDTQYDIQELLASSELLITDYSSVHFDFSYMDKPVIYYQFDSEEFFKKQYSRSFFDFERDGFGPVVSDASALASKLERYAVSSFANPEEYTRRMRSFYVLRDGKNCERVFSEIKKRF
ncbi:MAG: CDP-glycerol glycerophosphotransferase family protein, partial [Firmicutes bacterium]|nr:CDP-glycerol glycerophosphotransferase family protein [Candidatus Colimorpha enterica]